MIKYDNNIQNIYVIYNHNHKGKVKTLKLSKISKTRQLGNICIYDGFHINEHV